MSIDIPVPQLPESVADATISRWVKNKGDSVKRDEVVLELETDKVVLEVPAPADGVLAEINYQEGDTVSNGDILGQVKEGSVADTPTDTSDSSEKDSNSQKASSAPQGSSSEGETVEVPVPSLPESVADATVSVWHKKVGDAVKRDENLVDLETDKVVLEVPAPADGVLTSIEHNEGDVVGNGAVLGLMTKGATPAASAAASEADKTDSGDNADSADAASSPAVRRLLEEHQIDAGAIPGSGKNGRLLKADVQAYIEQQKNQTTQAKPAPAVATSVARAEDEKAEIEPVLPPGGMSRTEQRVPMTRVRKRIAERLVESQQTAAILSTFNEVDLTEVKRLRDKYRDQFEKEYGVRLGYMSFFVKAVVEGLRRYPIVNAAVDGDEIVYHSYFDIGIAVASNNGLIVPIIRNADELNFGQIEQQIADYGQRAQTGKVKIDEMMGGTFSITNGGVFGSMMSTPIINPPQSAILGMHAINERAIVRDGEIVSAPMMYLAVSYDHRIIDGKDSVQFLKTVKDALEDPARLLLQL